MKLKITIACLIVTLVLILTPCLVFAWDFGIGVASDWTGEWWTGATEFADIIDSYQGWSEGFESHDLYATWW